MADLLLSESLLQNNEGLQTQRDPFQAARQQYQNKLSSNDNAETLLSSSPMSNPANDVTALNQTPVLQSSEVKQVDQNDYKSLLKSLGINADGIELNDDGKNALITRLREKFGDNFGSSNDAANVMKVFSQQFNKSLESANRVLGVLLSGQSNGTQITGGLKGRGI